MHRTKEYRLMQEKKHKKKAKRYFSWALRKINIDNRLIGIRAKTRKQCSCWDCGNKRRYEGKTRREKQIEEKMHEEIKYIIEYGNNEEY